MAATALSAPQVILAWHDKWANEGGFRVEVSTDGVHFTPAGTTGANVASYSVTGLTAGTTYTFRVRRPSGFGTHVELTVRW